MELRFHQIELGIREKLFGNGYSELTTRIGSYLSADGTRVFRIGVGNITGAYCGSTHVYVEPLIHTPAKDCKKYGRSKLPFLLNALILVRWR